MKRAFLLLLLIVGIYDVPGRAALYQVGPGKSLESPIEVPWENLKPGDTVEIFWRPEPYREKWVISGQGTSEQPITVRGILGPKGERPVIHGDGARTRTGMSFSREARGVIKVGGTDAVPDVTPQYIVIEGLEIRSARPAFHFYNGKGVKQEYTSFAAALDVEKCEHLTVRNCALHDSALGLLVSSSDQRAARSILIAGCSIYDNGISNSTQQHNVYTAAIDITFEYNWLGQLREGCLGANLKDRSAGLVVRYNWVEGGGRQLDLVDGEDSSLIRNDPRYRTTFVYGNVLIEPAGAGNPQMIHYGGDSGKPETYRKGTVFVYHNTFVSLRPDQTTVIKLSSHEETCELHNNIVSVPNAGQTCSLLSGKGTLRVSHNWFKEGYRHSFENPSGKIDDDGTSIVGKNPGFVNLNAVDFRLSSTSPCIDAAGSLPNGIPPQYAVTGEYVSHRLGKPRTEDAKADLGAFEYQP